MRRSDTFIDRFFRLFEDRELELEKEEKRRKQMKSMLDRIISLESKVKNLEKKIGQMDKELTELRDEYFEHEVIPEESKYVVIK